MLLVLSIISALLSLFYIGLMGFYRHGWKTTPLVAQKNSELVLKVTVIVPARNEVATITKCLAHLWAQTYPKNLVEVIIADDHSTDFTIQKVLTYKKEKAWEKLNVLELASIPGKKFKKAAITEAIKIATGDIIVTTDADCAMGADWLHAVVSFFESTGALLVSAPVVYDFEHSTQPNWVNFFMSVQQLEFAGLVGIGGAALKLGHPNMCNGANLAYRKEVFDEVGGYTGNDNLPSGDDEFLMHKVYAKYPQKVHFLKHKDAIVKTPPSYTWKSFWAQRTRWVSKSTKYSDKKITLLLSLAYLFNLSILINAVLGFFSSSFWGLLGGQLFLKICVEYWYYGPVLRFFNLGRLLNFIIPAQLFHIVYVLLIGILGNFAPYNWKGRKQ